MRIRSHYEMSHCHTKCAIVAFVAYFAVTSSELVWKPENSFAINGDQNSVILKCNSSLGYHLSWLVKRSSSSEKCQIYNGYRLSRSVNYCSVDSAKSGKYDLTLISTTNAAQQYICREPGTLMEASAEVIIIQSNPECSNVTTDELTTLTCHIRFHGNWAPVMQWTMDNMTEVISEGVNNTRDNDTLTSRIVIPGNQSGIDAINYTCTTDFRIQEKPSDTTANNIPMYKHTWTYTAEHRKGTDDANEETEDMDMEDNSSKREIAAISVAVVLLLLAGLIVYIRRTSDKKASNSDEEVDV